MIDVVGRRVLIGDWITYTTFRKKARLWIGKVYNIEIKHYANGDAKERLLVQKHHRWKSHANLQETMYVLEDQDVLVVNEIPYLYES